METLLDELDLLQFVQKLYLDMVEFREEDTADQRAKKEKKLSELRKSDRRCMSQIIQRIDDSHLENAKEKDNAYILWNSLATIFERKGMAIKLFLRKKILTMKIDAIRKTMANHFLQFDKLVRELKMTGANLEENDVVCHLLLTMPTEYDIIVTALETLSVDQLTVSFVKSRVLDEETKRKTGSGKTNYDSNSTTVFTSQTGGRDSGSSKSSGKSESSKSNKHKFRCY